MMRVLSPRLLVLSAATSLACGAGQSTSKTADEGNTSAANTSGPAAAPSEPAAEETWEGEADATGAGAEAGNSNANAAPAAASEEETRTTDVIGKIVRDNRKPFRACYEKGKAEIPDLRGTLTLHFVLDPEGKVKVAELNAERSTIQSPVVVECAVRVLTGLTFPPSSRGMESNVNYPFDFKP